MSDAGADIFKAARAAILADATLSTQLQGRVYSSWNNMDTAHPLIRFSIPETRVFEIDGGGEGDEFDFNVHIFTSEASPIVCRGIARRVRAILHRSALGLDTVDLVALDYRATVGPRADASDPLLQMAVLRFMARAVEK